MSRITAKVSSDSRQEDVALSAVRSLDVPSCWRKVKRSAVAPYLLPSLQHVKRDHDPPSISSWLPVCHGSPGVRASTMAAKREGRNLELDIAYARDFQKMSPSLSLFRWHAYVVGTGHGNVVEQRFDLEKPRRSYTYTLAKCTCRLPRIGERSREHTEKKRKRKGRSRRRKRRARIQRRRDLTASLNGINYYASSSPSWPSPVPSFPLSFSKNGCHPAVSSRVCGPPSRHKDSYLTRKAPPSLPPAAPSNGTLSLERDGIRTILVRPLGDDGRGPNFGILWLYASRRPLSLSLFLSSALHLPRARVC